MGSDSRAQTHENRYTVETVWLQLCLEAHGDKNRVLTLTLKTCDARNVRKEPRGRTSEPVYEKEMMDSGAWQLTAGMSH